MTTGGRDAVSRSVLRGSGRADPGQEHRGGADARLDWVRHGHVRAAGRGLARTSLAHDEKVDDVSMSMRCLLCSELDGLLLDFDLIVDHMRREHDIDIMTWADGAPVWIDPEPKVEEFL